ncbi:MAG TPA: hypothetical protein VHB02_14515 [Acidimicrobiales bacterium]|nr:hypothetical protein [Acidimicrobiales bacterium]
MAIFVPGAVPLATETATVIGVVVDVFVQVPMTSGSVFVVPVKAICFAVTAVEPVGLNPRDAVDWLVLNVVVLIAGSMSSRTVTFFTVTVVVLVVNGSVDPTVPVAVTYAGSLKLPTRHEYREPVGRLINVNVSVNVFGA